MHYEKPIQELSEEWLFNSINNHDPRYGNLAQYELLRRLALENSKSSKRFAAWSLTIAIIAIIISIAASDVWLSLRSESVRKSCYQSVLQAPDIDLNYKNCLRSRGLE